MAKAKVKKRRRREKGGKRDSTHAAPLLGAFELDLRALAAMRIVMAAILIADLCNRLRSFTAHYTDSGALPRSAYLAEFSDPWQWSLHVMAGNELVLGLFALAFVFAFMLLVGYRTRVAAVLSWVLLASLHTRNIWVMQAGDDLLRLLAFWAMFLPIGARYSVDRVIAPPEDEPRTSYSIATIGFVLQLLLIYLFASMLKAGHAVWWKHGEGVWYALNVEQFTTRIGLAMLAAPALLKLLTYTTLVVQLVLPPLMIVVPQYRARLRLIVPLILIGIHVAFMITMQIGLFSYIVVAFWLAMLPPRAWDQIEDHMPNWLRGGAGAIGRAIARFDGGVRKLLSLGVAKPAKAATVSASIAARVFLGAVIVWIVWWNGVGTKAPQLRMPEPLTVFGRALRLDQRWSMFSNPPRASNWYVVRGQRADGTDSDLLTGKPVSFDKPELVSATFPSQRWRKYLNNIARESLKAHRPHYLRYMCRAHAGIGEKALESVEFYMVQQRTPPPGGIKGPPKRVLLERLTCPGRS